MATLVYTEKGEQREIDVVRGLFYWITPKEGDLNQVYGRIGNGKTYCATVDALWLLNHGYIVKTNWKIKWEGYDERKILFYRILGVLGLKRNFAYYPKSNYEQFRVDGNFLNWISKQTSCNIFIDEGHIAYDSYEMARMSMEKRVSILSTRHFDRRIFIISQRATAIHATIRGNVNRFYKCELKFKLFGICRFHKTEFQDTKDDIPDETREMVMREDGTVVEKGYKYAVSTERYWSSSKIFKSYDSKYLRGDTPESQKDNVVIYRYLWKEQLRKMFRMLG